MHGEFANAYLFSGNMPSGTNAVVEVMHRYFMIVGWPMYAVRLLKVYPPPPLFFFGCYFQDSVGIHREEWQASLHMVLAIG